MVFDRLVIRLNTHRTVVVEAHTCIADELSTLQYVICHHWLEYVELVVALSTCHSNCSVVPHYLCTNHSHGLSLRWIYLSWHD